ncbi:MAG TPA: glycosyltransferase family 4 protein [Alphaproteobacteria bacterium]|nr:glycosyltransferase family 4 protein [Alphaproteobacteria bacterium]
MGVETIPPVAAEREATTLVAPPDIRSLQIGMRWFGNGSGGLDRVFYDLANALPAQGVAVQGLVVQPADVATQTGGRIQAFADDGAGLPNRLLGVRRAVRHSLKSGDIGLIAGHFALYLAPVLDILGDTSLVMHFHGPWAQESGVEGQRRGAVFAKKALERFVYRRADRFIVLSNAFAELLMREYGVPHGRIRIVPGSVDLERFTDRFSKDAARAALRWPADRPILLSIRRLIARVGLDKLVEAMKAVKEAVPEVLLCIAGRGPLEGALRAQIAEAGLQNNVRLLGFLPDEELPVAYRAADINVVPTTALEGFGLTAAEALAAGTPSMVTPVGGLPEVVSGLSPDLVFASCKTGDLAAGLIAALRGDTALPGSAECRAYAETHFATSLAAQRTAAVYRELTA